MKQNKLFFVLCLFAYSNALAENTNPKITILSTMIANYLGEGEWGFSALIETREKSILFDTGFKSQTVLNNARALNINLGEVGEVVLTHFHTDHTGGLLTLRRAFMEEYPKALATVYVGKGFFLQRYSAEKEEIYSLRNPGFTESFSSPLDFRHALEAEGVRFIVVDATTEIAKGVFLTGPIPRVHPEKNVSPGFFLKSSDKYVADTVPESQVLGIDTDKGWLLVSGCGHAGIVNASEHLLKIKKQPIYMGLGGFHLFRASDEIINNARLNQPKWRVGNP